MLVVHPQLADITQERPDLGGGNPNILWVTISLQGETYFILSFYFPDNRKGKEADVTARQICTDLETIGGPIKS